jgi:hypothetical protein
MAWWHRLFSRKAGVATQNPAYEVPFRLYSKDGAKEVEVRVRRDGRAYFVEREWVEGTTFRDRGFGEEIGPYETPEAAEAAAAVRPWFLDDDNSN